MTIELAERDIADTDAVPGRGVMRQLDLVLIECLRRGAGALHLDMVDGCMIARMRFGGMLEAAQTFARRPARAIEAALRAHADVPDGGGEGRLAAGGGDWLVSMLPTRDGARYLLRTTGRIEASEPLARIGMPRAMVRTIDAALFEQTGGVIVVAGPPRSGRSTTLATLLARLDTGSRRLLSIGGESTPARPAVTIDDRPGGTADALRRVLRQDPDIVTIDEVPDRETAQLAFEAARTRRLLLLGIAADDALGAIARLRTLRVERFLLASTLRVVVAQRLARRLCSACRRPVQAPSSTSALLGFDPGAVIHASDGCAACDHSGYRGQVPVFEAVACDAAIGRLLNDGGDAAILARHAFVAAPDLGSAARMLVREGATSPEEALRIARAGAAAIA